MLADPGPRTPVFPNESSTSARVIAMHYDLQSPRSVAMIHAVACSPGDRDEDSHAILLARVFGIYRNGRFCSRAQERSVHASRREQRWQSRKERVAGKSAAQLWQD